MQVFDYTIEYKPGSKKIADSLSRLSCCQSQEDKKMRNIAEEYVQFIIAQGRVVQKPVNVNPGLNVN